MESKRSQQISSKWRNKTKEQHGNKRQAASNTELDIGLQVGSSNLLGDHIEGKEQGDGDGER